MSADQHENIYRTEPVLLSSFYGVMLELDRINPDALSGEEESLGKELLEPIKEYTLRHFQLDPALATKLDLGETVSCRVMRDGLKQVLIISSLNLFERRSYGYFIQPKDTDFNDPQGHPRDKDYEVWEAPVKHFYIGNRKWGMEKLDFDLASLTSPEVSNGLIRSLMKNPTGREL